MSTEARGNLLDHTPAEVEAGEFARAHAFDCVDKGDGPRDAKLQGLVRRLYQSKIVAGLELELLVSEKGRVEVAGVWFDRRLLGDRTQMTGAVTAYAAFLGDAMGKVAARDHDALGNLLAVSYELVKAGTFQPVLDRFPFLPHDGVGAATEVFLGRREEAAQPVMDRAATLVVRNDKGGRLFVGIATQAAAFDLSAMLFTQVTFRKGDRSGVVGWKTPELETTPFGRRYGLDLDRAAPPVGRIARRYFGMERIPRSAHVELLVEPTKGMAGVLLRIEQSWIEQSDRNYFAALEVIAAFVAEGIGDIPDARTKMEVAHMFSCSKDDEDLFKVLHASLPFVLKGDTGDGTAVFLGEEESAVAWLDEGRCGLVVHENADGWLDCLFYLTELADEIGTPAVRKA
ncbi:MAG: hypothetical protein U0326_35550 [Polyangiales bacterium]